MEISQIQLDQWRRCLDCLRGMAEEGTRLLGPESPERARALLQDIHDHSVQIGLKMEQAGAALPSAGTSAEKSG